MIQSRREAALALAGETLVDIEQSRISSSDIVKKASHLARLLDDVDAVNWLSYEISGFEDPMGKTARSSFAAAQRSRRHSDPDIIKTPSTWTMIVNRMLLKPSPPAVIEERPRVRTTTLNRLQAEVDGARLQLQAAADPDISISSANPDQTVASPKGNVDERDRLRRLIGEKSELIGKVVGAVYAYVAEREIELRFGAAVEKRVYYRAQ